MEKLLKYLLILAIAILPFPSFAGDIDNYSIWVSVSVNTNDATTKKKVESFISRELRQLGDVTVTDHHPEYELDVTVIEKKLNDGRTVEYGIAFSVIPHFNYI